MKEDEVVRLFDNIRARREPDSGERTLRTMNVEYAILQFAKMRNLVTGSGIYFTFEGTHTDKQTTFLMTFKNERSLRDENDKAEVEVKLSSDGWKCMTKKYNFSLGPSAEDAFLKIKGFLESGLRVA